MTVIVKCDLCGKEAQTFLALRLGRTDEVRDGEVLGHYHPACVDRVIDAVDLFTSAHRSIDALPVAEPPQNLVSVVGVRAFRAFAGAGIMRFEDAAGRSEAEVAAIRGIGPSSLAKVKQEMLKQGLRFRASGVSA